MSDLKNDDLLAALSSPINISPGAPPEAPPATSPAPPPAPVTLATFLAEQGIQAVLQELLAIDGALDDVVEVLTTSNLPVTARLYLLARTPVVRVELPSEMGPQVPCVYYDLTKFPKPVKCILAKGMGLQVNAESPLVPSWTLKGDFRGKPGEPMAWTREQCGYALFELNAFMILAAHQELAAMGVQVPLNLVTPTAAPVAEAPRAITGDVSSDRVLAIQKLLGALSPAELAALGVPAASGASVAPAAPAAPVAPVAPATPPPATSAPTVTPSKRPAWAGAKAVDIPTLPTGWAWTALGKVAEGPDRTYCVYFAQSQTIQGVGDGPDGSTVQHWTAYQPVPTEGSKGKLFATGKSSLAEAIAAVPTAKSS